MYKTSRYNHYSKAIENRISVINLLTGAIVKLNLNIGNKLLKKSFNEIDVNTLKILESKGFIYQNDNEISLIEKLKSQRTETKHKEIDKKSHFYIIPTLDCNLVCDYCYLQEFKKDTVVMSKEEVDAIINLITSYKSDKLRVTLIGGEPLLPNTKYIVKYIIEKLTEHDIIYDIITNGVFLKEFINEGIINKNVKNIQITLDGNREQHDNKRYLPENGTFDTLIANVELALKNDIFVFVRLNVLENNVPSISELFSLFEEKGFIKNKNFQYYITPILDNGNYQSFDVPNRQHLIEDILTIDEKILSNLDTRHFHGYHYIKSVFTNGKPLYPTLSRCEATLGNYCFTPQGRIYSCIEALGNENFIVGTYVPKLEIFQDKMKIWTDMDFVNDDCVKCKAAFICAGGCPRKELITERTDCDLLRKEISISFDYFLKKHDKTK